MTPAQLATLKAAIVAASEFDGIPNNTDGALIIAEALNQTAAPSFTVWKSSVSENEILQNGFDWTRLDNLSVGLARIWDKIFSGPGRTLNPGKSNVRAGIEAVWVGSAPDLAVRAAVYVHCKRLALRIEKILATGTGSDASPAVLGYEGQVSFDDVDAARHLP